jgi:enoyl-[acyl-carrier protein] reductase II
MLQTPLCTLLGIEFPIIQAGMGVFTSAELAAAVSNAGGLGSVGTFLRPAEDLPQQLARLRAWTRRAFAVNHLVPTLDEGAFAHTLAARPPVIVLALGDPGDLVQRAHDVGSLVIQQVTTVPQAREAAARGVDVIIAQGGEAGGYGGTIATFALLPQVVDAVRPLPVVAAGGIADGRGLAAALVLGSESGRSCVWCSTNSKSCIRSPNSSLYSRSHRAFFYRRYQRFQVSCKGLHGERIVRCSKSIRHTLCGTVCVIIG